MRYAEIVRWTLPLTTFIGFVNLGDVGVSLLFASIVFAAVSAAIRWHKRDPLSFHVGVRAWIMVLLIAPSALAVVGTAVGFPPALLLSVPALVISVWLFMLNAEAVKHCHIVAKHRRNQSA